MRRIVQVCNTRVALASVLTCADHHQRTGEARVTTAVTLHNHELVIPEESGSAEVSARDIDASLAADIMKWSRSGVPRASIIKLVAMEFGVTYLTKAVKTKVGWFA
jgi:hypothetical protein